MCFKLKSMPLLQLHACQVICCSYFRLHKNDPLLIDVIAILMHDDILLYKYVRMTDN